MEHYCDSLKKPNTSLHSDIYNSSVGFFSAFWHQLSFSVFDVVFTFYTGTIHVLFMLIVKEPEGNTHLIQQLRQTFLSMLFLEVYSTGITAHDTVTLAKTMNVNLGFKSTISTSQPCWKIKLFMLFDHLT